MTDSLPPLADLSGKTVAITGASRGIGAASARAFAEAGAQVALLARSEEEIAALAGEIGQSALAIPCDVTRYWEVEKALIAACQTFGSLDVLVNNAGAIAPMDMLSDVDPEAWDALIDINIKGAFHALRAAVPLMLEGGGGTVLNVSSGAANRPTEGWSAYCTSKAGLLMLTRAADLELRGQGIRVMGLSPGTVATQMQRDIKESRVDNAIRRLEWSDHIPPDWPARALVWMTTPAADAHLGADVSLRDPAVRAELGLDA